MREDEKVRMAVPRRDALNNWSLSVACVRAWICWPCPTFFPQLRATIRRSGNDSQTRRVDPKDVDNKLFEAVGQSTDLISCPSMVLDNSTTPLLCAILFAAFSELT